MFKQKKGPTHSVRIKISSSKTMLFRYNVREGELKMIGKQITQLPEVEEIGD